MTDLRKAAEMALPLLVAYQDYTGDSRIANKCGEAIEALRQALADQKLADAFAEDFPNTWGKKKHTAPPSKPWVSLTDEEIDYIWGVTPPDYENFFEFPRAIEAKLREKNT